MESAVYNVQVSELIKAGEDQVNHIKSFSTGQKASSLWLNKILLTVDRDGMCIHYLSFDWVPLMNINITRVAVQWPAHSCGLTLFSPGRAEVENANRDGVLNFSHVGVPLSSFFMPPRW